VIEQVSCTECAKRLKSEKDSEENTNQLAARMSELKQRNATLTAKLHTIRKFLIRKRTHKMTHPVTKVNTFSILVNALKPCVI